MNRVTAVQARRTALGAVPLRVDQRRAAVARRLFYDLCVIAGHPRSWPGVINCPADFGLAYTGVFYAGERPLAMFSYRASGCESLRLRTRPLR
jgi:hypothetical protein